MAARFCNGTHTCAIQPDKQGSSKYIVLLNISPELEVQGSVDASALAALDAGHALPEVGERVLVELCLDPAQGRET